MGIFDTIFKARADLEGQLKKLRADIEQAQRERDAVRSAPSARADVKAALVAYIGTLGASYREALQGSIETLVRQPQVLASMASAPGKLLRSPILGAAEPMAENISAKALDSAFAALFGDALSKAVAEVVDAMEWPANEGLSMAERAPKVERLNQQIEKLLAEEQQLLAQAEKAGLHITPY